MAGDDAQWFHRVADEFGRRRKLKAVIVKDGPNAFKAQYGKKADGKPLYELFIDFVAQRASLLDRDVPYGEVELVFRSGEQEQFSPFDDLTRARPTRLDIRAWLEQRCAGKPMLG
jgi:hypothetical protein